MKQTLVAVEPKASKDWPHGRIKVTDGEQTLRFTPNQARRLVEYLSQAIIRAEQH